MMSIRWVLLGVLPLCLLSPMALAQDFDARLNRIENDIQTLSRAVYRGENPPSSSSADLRAQADAQVQIQQLETQLRQMNGRLEEQSHEIRQLRTELERFSSDARMRFDALEAKKVQSQPAVSALQKEGTQEQQPYKWSSKSVQQQNSVIDPQPVALSKLPGDQAAASYESAFSLLKAARYDEAEQGFVGFLKTYPDHALVGNAQYWLGETYYVRGKYDEAAQAFAEGFKKYPKGAKAPDNLLKLGMSLAAMGKKEDACLALAQIDQEFANVAVPVQRRATQEMTRLGCQG